MNPWFSNHIIRGLFNNGPIYRSIGTNPSTVANLAILVALLDQRLMGFIWMMTSQEFLDMGSNGRNMLIKLIGGISMLLFPSWVILLILPIILLFENSFPGSTLMERLFDTEDELELIMEQCTWGSKLLCFFARKRGITMVAKHVGGLETRSTDEPTNECFITKHTGYTIMEILDRMEFFKWVVFITMYFTHSYTMAPAIFLVIVTHAANLGRNDSDGGTLYADDGTYKITGSCCGIVVHETYGYVSDGVLHVMSNKLNTNSITINGTTLNRYSDNMQVTTFGGSHNGMYDIDKERLFIYDHRGSGDCIKINPLKTKYAELYWDNTKIGNGLPIFEIRGNRHTFVGISGSVWGGMQWITLNYKPPPGGHFIEEVGGSNRDIENTISTVINEMIRDLGHRKLIIEIPEHLSNLIKEKHRNNGAINIKGEAPLDESRNTEFRYLIVMDKEDEDILKESEMEKTNMSVIVKVKIFIE